MKRRSIALTAATLALALVGSSCSSLRERDPWTATITLDEGPFGSVIVSAPAYNERGLPLLKGDGPFGEVQVVNNTAEKHTFSIDELAVFVEIHASRSVAVEVPEAKDDRTYYFYCHLHPAEYRGAIVIDYIADEDRG